MKKLLSILLTIVMIIGLFALTSCTGNTSDSGENNDKSNDRSDGNTGDDSEAPNGDSVISDLKIGGTALSEFVIVYGSDGTESLTRHNGKWIESSRNKDVAEAIATEIYELTGQQLAIKSYTEGVKNHEILVGRCNNRPSKYTTFYDKLGTITDHSRIDDFEYGVIDTKLIFSGGSVSACYKAALAFIKDCRAMSGSDFTASPKSGKADLIRVACVGDSITNGSCSTNENYYSYPVHLQKMLGYNYYVGNYGHGGKAASNYATESHNYVQSIDLKADVLFFMLGTNDAGGEKDAYRQNIDNLIKSYKNANPDVQVFMMTPPYALRNPLNIYIGHFSEIIIEYARSNGFKIINNYTISTRDSWVLPDKVHPDDATYKILAETIYNIAKKSIKTSK